MARPLPAPHGTAPVYYQVGDGDGLGLGFVLADLDLLISCGLGLGLAGDELVTSLLIMPVASVNRLDFRDGFDDFRKLNCGLLKILVILAVLTRSASVTDGRTDGQNCRSIYFFGTIVYYTQVFLEDKLATLARTQFDLV